MAAVSAAKIESFSFDGEAVGAAGASALRGIKSLAERAPAGRLFASIATLSDTAAEAAAAFEAAGLATLRNEIDEAQAQLEFGGRMARRLKEALGADIATPLPPFMRRTA